MKGFSKIVVEDEFWERNGEENIQLIDYNLKPFLKIWKLIYLLFFIQSKRQKYPRPPFKFSNCVKEKIDDWEQSCKGS